MGLHKHGEDGHLLCDLIGYWPYLLVVQSTVILCWSNSKDSFTRKELPVRMPAIAATKVGSILHRKPAADASSYTLSVSCNQETSTQYAVEYSNNYVHL